MNRKPEIGRYPDPEGRNHAEGRLAGLRRGPPTGWRMAAAASGLVALSAMAGLASLFAGALLLLPLAVLAIPFLVRRSRNRNRRSGGFFPRRPAGFRF